MLNGKLLILYLDYDRVTSIRARHLPEMQAIILPETRAHVRTNEMPLGVEVLIKQALNPTTDGTAVYEPSSSVLQQIRELTATGKVDIVIIGNNMGAGVRKAAQVAPDMRHNAIIMSSGGLTQREEDAYRNLGYIRFATRSLLHMQLSALMEELSSNS